MKGNGVDCVDLLGIGIEAMAMPGCYTASGENDFYEVINGWRWWRTKAPVIPTSPAATLASCSSKLNDL